MILQFVLNFFSSIILRAQHRFGCQLPRPAWHRVNGDFLSRPILIISTLHFNVLCQNVARLYQLKRNQGEYDPLAAAKRVAHKSSAPLRLTVVPIINCIIPSAKRYLSKYIDNIENNIATSGV